MNSGGKSPIMDSDSEVDFVVSELLSQVGNRVRSARERKGVSRRVLSEKSGVSQRYLAQLEAGAGNISIGLLKRVSHSLGHKIEWLVGEDDPWVSTNLRVAELFAAADSETQDLILRTLRAVDVQSSRAQRVCLIGLRGAGKSTLGKMAADKLEVPFLELNKEIASIGGMAIEEIVALYGQEGYRKLEASSLDKVIETHDRMILAVAGGIVSDPETFKKLQARFHTIWLKATPQEHMDRVRAQGDERPMAGNADAMEELKSILTSREALYARANEVLDTSQRPLNVSLDELLTIIETHAFFGA